MRKKDKMILKIMEKNSPIHIDTLNGLIFNKGIYRQKHYIKLSLKRLEDLGYIKIDNFKVEIRGGNDIINKKDESTVVR